MCFSLSLNGLERVSKRFVFCLIIWNEFLSVRNGSEWNYRVPSVFLFYKMVRNGFPNFFSSADSVERNFEPFPFRKTGGIPTEWFKISFRSVFRRIIFFFENGNPSYESQTRSLLGAKNVKNGEWREGPWDFPLYVIFLVGFRGQKCVVDTSGQRNFSRKR